MIFDQEKARLTLFNEKPSISELLIEKRKWTKHTNTKNQKEKKYQKTDPLNFASSITI